MATTPYPFVAGAVLTASQLNSTFNIPTTTKTASYTLTAADAGTRIYMNSASATTITVNTSIFAASDIVEIFNIGAGVTTITAGTATVSSAGPLAIPQYGSGRLTFTAAGASIYTPTAVTATSSGLVCVKAETAVSAAASATADGIFTSTYTNYLLLVNFTTSADQLCIKFRASGVSTSSGYNTQQILIDDTTITSSRVTSQANIRIQQSVGAESSSIIQIFNPQLAIPTRLTQHTALNIANYTTGAQLNMRASNQSGSTAFDGIELLALSGTWTGNYAIYGYSKVV